MEFRRPAGRRSDARSRREASAGALIERLGAGLPRSAVEGKRRLAAWLAELEGTKAGAALASLIAHNAGVGRLLAGIAEAAPFLFDLIRADPERALRLLRHDPEAALAAVLATTQGNAAAATDGAQVMRGLRIMKAHAALTVALADIGGVWPVARVTAALTAVAEAALGIAIRHLLADATRRGALMPPDPGDPELGSGLIVLAMGKMGAHELNFSSDIDLMVFYDPSVPGLPDDVEPSTFYVRLARELVKFLQERTADGYVFRVDLRLRPDPASTQIAISYEAALNYYEGRGQNWERAALIKARPAAGDRVAGERLLRDLSPFVWRKYLDYAAVADVHAMKQEIHAYRGHGEIAVEGHNIKLGRGGIREIEFFVQTQQLIAGGRHGELRGRGTVATLGALAAGGWIDAATRDELAAAYDFLRRVEHRLQMIADEQTHTLPQDASALSRLARFLGYSGRAAFAKQLLRHLRTVERHYVRLFESASDLLARQQNLSFAAGADGRETLDRLAEMGFKQPHEVTAAVGRWQASTYRALRGEQARTSLAILIPAIIDQFARAENPDAAFAAFDRFLAELRAGGRLLSLLRQNPELIRFVALILGVAPRLADILAQNPHVIDPLIDPSFFGALPETAQLETQLTEALGEAPSYEDMLDAVRMFGQEHMFLIGTRILSGSLSAEQAGEVFAALADVLIRGVHARVERDFRAVYGGLAGQEVAILALGRLGAREMTATSDLDLIVIYDFDGQHPNSDGGRSLYGGQYFARLTQRLISALTVKTNYGVLYEVDMRLRPSGRSGPVATQIDGFISYQDNEAWIWEHMALTRARVISGSPAFAARIETAIRDALCRRRTAARIAADVADMRMAIAKEKGDAEPWDLKYAAGGLVDIEFIAQYLQLVHAAAMPEILDHSTARILDKAARLEVLTAGDAELLGSAVRLFHDLIQILRLCLPGKFDPSSANAGVLALLARAADLPDFPALHAYVLETQKKVRECFVRIVGRPG